MRWLGRRNPTSPSFKIEGLESRVVLSAGPVLTGVELFGPVTAINSVVLTFSESLSPASTQNLAAYAFGKPPLPASSSSSSGLSILDFLPFRETGRVKPDTVKLKLTKNGKILFSSAVYDDANHTVTLTPIAPFGAQIWYRFLRVKGSGPNRIVDLDGNPLNGGVDTVGRWTMYQGKTIRYVDSNHDHVTFTLTGPGKLFVFRRSGKDSDPSIFVESATSATVVTGSVFHTNALVSTINVAEISGFTGVTNNLLNNPMFNVQTPPM